MDTIVAGDEWSTSLNVNGRVIKFKLDVSAEVKRCAGNCCWNSEEKKYIRCWMNETQDWDPDY